MKPTCIIDGCTNPQYSRQWCRIHYHRWWRRGDPHSLARFSDPEEAFAARTEWQGDCLIWTGAAGPLGYGRIRVYGTLKPAHRYAWERKHGTIPEGMLIDHKFHCNPACVNIEHLRLATRAQNQSHRAGATIRSATGVRNVYWDRQVNRYRVTINKDYIRYDFGSFESLEEAQAAAKAGRAEVFGAYAGRG